MLTEFSRLVACADLTGLGLFPPLIFEAYFSQCLVDIFLGQAEIFHQDLF